MKKNLATITHKNSYILIWQDSNLNWVYSIDSGAEVSSQSKELQTALNLAHETIDERGDGLLGRLMKKVKVDKKIMKPRGKKQVVTKKVAAKK